MSNPSRTIQRIAGVLLAASAVVGPAASAANPERPSPERPYGGSCSTVIVPITPPGTVPQQLHLEYECQLAHIDSVDEHGAGWRIVNPRTWVS